jgi:hypothetical protein
MTGPYQGHIGIAATGSLPRTIAAPSCDYQGHIGSRRLAPPRSGWIAARLDRL